MPLCLCTLFTGRFNSKCSLKVLSGKRRRETKEGIQRPLQASVSSQSSPFSEKQNTESCSIETSASETPCPWEAWRLDQVSLRQLYGWNLCYPEERLGNILRRICDLIDKGMKLADVIPDSPVPLRGFIKALAHLVKFSASISEVKFKTVEFVQDIAQWVDNIAYKYGGGGRGYFTLETWKDLAEMRELIDEICKWANDKLNGTSLSQRLASGLVIDAEIEDFKRRLQQATQRFMFLSNITLVQAQDNQTQMISAIHNETNERNVVNTQQEHLARMFSRHLVHDVDYEFQEKLPCDPQTRAEILSEIWDWILNVSDDAQSFFWLSGPPGVGKSSIAASVAKECQNEGFLWAQFFINRNDRRTTNPRALLPSIVKQMSERSPHVSRAIHGVLEHRSPLDGISEEQARKLFVDAIQAASPLNASRRRPAVVVIDALDETDRGGLRDTVEAFSQLVVDLPCTAKVFVSSRTEDFIRNSFAASFTANRGLPKDLSTQSSTTEVSMFLRRNVEKIMRDECLDWSRWGDRRMATLCRKASGLFLWAVTAIEYFRAHARTSGVECLISLLDGLNTQSMNSINSLYMVILNQTYDSIPMDRWVFQRFRRIVGALLVRQDPLCLADIEPLLNLLNPGSVPADITRFIRLFRTVLVAGDGEINGQTIPQIHKSFAEFITSSHAGEFCVDTTASNGELAIQCIRQLDQFSASADVSGPLYGPLTYAFVHWPSHLTQLARTSAGGSMENGRDFAPGSSSEDNVLPQADIGDIPPCVRVSQTPPISDGTMVVHSMVLSPNRKCILAACSDMTIHRWDYWTCMPLLAPLRGHTGIVQYAAFSPDGSRIVSASSDNTLRVWDSVTGEALLTLEGHTCVVNHAAFSPDGKWIVSASSDKTIRIWDAETGEVLWGPLEGHTCVVQHVAFSPTGRRIASASSDMTVRIWDTETGMALLRSFEGHTCVVHHVAFSPNGKWVVSASSDKTIRLWDSGTGEQLADSHASETLSFTTGESTKYIVIPETSHGPHPVNGARYYFNMEGGLTQGIVGVDTSVWVYISDTFVLSSVQGLHTMRHILQGPEDCRIPGQEIHGLRREDNI